MGEHREDTARQWQIGRAEQDASALASHRHSVAAWERGFFDDLVIAVGDVKRDGIPRKDTTLEKLAKLPPAFDRTSGHGRSEEHTSELQSLMRNSYAVFCLKKKNTCTILSTYTHTPCT